MMSTVGEFFRNPLVTWVMSFRTTSTADTINDFADGVFLNEVMAEIDPTYFTLTRVHQNVDGDINVRIQNLDILVRHLKAFYQEKLQQLIVMRAPDVVAIAHTPDTDVGLQELVKIMLLMLGCAVQCDKKEHFIEKIKEMDLGVQGFLVEYIKEITDNPNHVFPFKMSELQDSTMEHVLVFAESMFYQMAHLVDERDQAFGDNTHLKLEKDSLLQEKQRAKSPRPFSPPPSTSQLSVDSPSIAATKEKVRMLTEEMEEKRSHIDELKEELLSSKKMIEKLRQENKDLSQDAVLVKAFRDQIDVLKEKADKTEKLETDVVKYKEKLRDLDYLKKRAEELKEENVILLENRQLLQEQLSGLSNKEERIEILEEENKKLKTHIHHLAEERQYEQGKLNEAMANNARLNIEKEESMAELASLNAEIEVLRGKSPEGLVNLASECNESSSMDVLRLSHQNEHLKKSLEDLRSSSTKLIELERENRTLHQKHLEEKSNVHHLTEELAKVKALNKQKTTENEKLQREVESMKDVLHMSSSEVLNLSGELKQKDVAIANLEIENYSQASELQNKSKDVEGKESNMAYLKERNLKYEKQLNVLETKNKDKDMVIFDKQKKIEELTETLDDKEKQLRGLLSRLNESVEEQDKTDGVIRKQRKEISELENKIEEAAIQKKKYEDVMKRKENEIAEYTQRFEEIQGSKSRSDDMVRKKDKESHEMKNKLQIAVEESDRLQDEIKGKDQKIQSLQKRIEDIMMSADENSESFSQNLREKDKQNRQLERRIDELVESLGEIDKMKETIKQKDDKINNLVKSLDEKEDQKRALESRLEDATSESNKLGHTIKLKEKKIDGLEASLAEIESSSFVEKDDRISEIKRTVEVRDNRIVELENKLEDLTSSNNKLLHSAKLKENKIVDLESRVEEIETLTFDKTRLTQNLEQRMRQIFDLESSLEDFKNENQRLQHTSKQKTSKVKELESKILEMEGFVELSQSLQTTLKVKDDKITLLNSNLQDREEKMAELENGLEEAQARIHKLKHSIKIKDEKIIVLENRIEELEALVSEGNKLSQISQQKDEKIRALEDEVDGLESVASTNEKLQKILTQKEEKINRLQERLDDVEDAVNMNNKLNQHLKHRENKIKALGKRILELEDTLEVREKEQMASSQASYSKIRELESSLEQITSIKVQRQNSVKRREDKIHDLEHNRTKLEEYVQEREAKVVALQSRLEGSVDRYRQMDMTIGEKEMKIAELEAKLSEANEACRENNKLRQMLKAKDTRLTELDNKVQMFESALSKNEKREQDRIDKQEALQKRLEVTLNLNNKLDQSVRKKEENIRTLEKTLQANEKREEELEVLLETRTEKLSESKNRVIELLDTIETKDKELGELNIRLDELRNATTSKQKTSTILKEKDKQLEELSERVRSLSNVAEQTEKLDKTKKEQERLLLETQASLEEVEGDKTKLLHTLKLKEKKIEDLEKKVSELETTKPDSTNGRNSTVTQKETKITILTQNNKKLEENLYNLENKVEESSSHINKLNRTLEQRDDRIKGLKTRLEEAVHQNNKLTHALELKDDKIKAAEERLQDSSRQIVQLREENQSRTPDKENKQGKSSSTIIFKPAYNSRDDRKTVQMLSVADKRIADLNDEIRVLEKQNTTIITQSEALSSRNAQLQIENESLRNELHLLKGDYSSLYGEINEARDYYHQLDLSAVNMGHRCEMLSQLNATLEEENKALHDKVSWLMGQNRELMVKNLEEKDQFMEEERFFSDKLYNLQRTKEKLEEQIDLANKALSEAAPPKKKPGFFKKVFKKAGLSKKKDEINKENKGQVQLLRADYHDEIDTSTISSEQHDDTMSSLRPPGRFDEHSIASRDSSASGDSGRGSKGMFSPNTSHAQSEVVMRRPRSNAATSSSSMMAPYEIEQPSVRKGSHDVSAFRARQTRSEIFADNFNTGRLSRPKSLDNLNKIGGFRGSNETLSSASAVTVDNVPSKTVRRGRTTPPPSPPSSAFRVVGRQNNSPYNSPITSKRAEVLRNSPTPRRKRDSPQSLSERGISSSPYNDVPRAKSPSPSPSRSRRSSFSSAVSGHDSDHEMDRRDDVSSKRSSIAERPPPPPYHSKGHDNSPRSESSGPSQARRSSRGPPPPYHKAQTSLDEEKRDDCPGRQRQTPDRRPPSYQEASKSPYGLKRSPSVNSRTGIPREDPTRYTNRGSNKETSRDSPRQEQRPFRQNQSTPQVPARRSGHTMDMDSPVNGNKSLMDDEPEVLIDATESNVSAVPIGPSSSQPKEGSPSDDNRNLVIPTFFRPVEQLKESPLRRMNSMPRYTSRSRSMEESQARTRKESSKTSDTLFAAVLVRQRSLSDNPPSEEIRRPTDLAVGPSAADESRLTEANSELDQFSNTAPGAESTPIRPMRQGRSSPDETASRISASSREDSESEGRSKSRSGSRTPQRGKNATHQWLEYGCV